MSNFEWQTEDEFDWDAPSVSPPEKPRRWFVPLLLFLLIGIVGYSVYDRLNDTVLSTTERVEAEVRATYQTVYSAADESDLELFNRLLSGRDRAWTAGQQQMVGGGGLLNRTAFGLETETRIPTIDAIELSADLSAAIVTATVPYNVQLHGEITQTVQFTLIDTLRKGSNSQWLYAPPLPEFWGETMYEPSLLVSFLPAISAEFPQRDSELVKRLLADLNRNYEQLCQLNADIQSRNPNSSNCQHNYNIVFSTNPSTLAELEDPAIEQPDRFFLPTPSLIGIPKDNAGYQALYTGYAQQIFPSLIAQMTGYECCDKQQYFDAVVAWQLDKIGLAGQRLSTQDYRRALAMLPNFNDSPWVWEQADPLVAAAIIDYFLTEYSALSGGDVVITLNESRVFSLWLQQLMSAAEVNATPPREILVKQQMTRLTQYLQNAVGDAGEPPIPFPAESLLMACSGQDETILVDYDLATDQATVQQRLPMMTNPRVTALPNTGSVWIQDMRATYDNSIPNAFLLRGGDEVIPVGQMNDSALSLNQAYPNGVLSLLSFSATDGRLSFITLDIADCNSAECSLDIATTLSSYSADGSYVIESNNGTRGQNLLRTKDRQLVRELIPSGSYIWLSDTIYAVRLGRLNFMTYSVDSPEPLHELTRADFEAVLPDGFLGGMIRADSYHFVAQRGDYAYLVVTPTANSDSSIIVRINLVDFSIEMISTVEGSYVRLQETTNDRYLTFQTWGINYVIYDLETNTLQAYPNNDTHQIVWSADGNWFLMMENGFGRIIAPEYDFIDFVAPANYCSSATWFSP